MNKKKITVFIGSRANYSSIKSLMIAIRDNDKYILDVIVSVSANLYRFGNVTELIKKDGFKISFSFNNMIEGSRPVSMAKTTGLCLLDVSNALDVLNPDYIIVVGDRYEMMAPTIAAAYMNIKIIHTMGGEVTGTIDESIRHAITKFSHIHFASNEDAKQRIIKLGENENFVFNIGCPRIDLVSKELKKESSRILSKLFKENKGVGIPFDLSSPFILVSQHPVTTENDSASFQIEQTLKALEHLKINTIMLWPNSDVGSDDISKAIRKFRENEDNSFLYLFKNLPINLYIHLMNTAACLVGNSSSGIREGAYIGTPVVNIGSRQNNRISGQNVLNCEPNHIEIINAIKDRVNSGKFEQENIYGVGNAAEKAIKIIDAVNPTVQKTITF